MSYSNLYQQVMTKLSNQTSQSRRQSRWCGCLVRPRSHTHFPTQRSENKAIRASKSSEQPPFVAAVPPRNGDARSLLIPAIMRVERARVNLKVSPRTKVSVCDSPASSSRCRKTKKRTTTKEVGTVVDDHEEAVFRCDSPPCDTRPSSGDLRLYLRTSEASYNPSSLRTSEIPASPGVASPRRPLHRTRNKSLRIRDLDDDAYILTMAEKAVASLLEAVVRMEAIQKKVREAESDPEVRAAMEERDKLANDEFVRSWLVEERMRLGQLEVAQFGELWDDVRKHRNSIQKGISYTTWLRAKHEKLREEQAREELKRREKQEAQQVRTEKAKEAYDKWCAETKLKPVVPPMVIYPTDDGCYKYVRPGAFCNPKPWVDLLEKKKRSKKPVDVATSPSGPKRPRPPPTRMCPLKVTRLGAGSKQSTYDSLVEFYTDLLRRYQPRGRPAKVKVKGRGGSGGEEVPVHGLEPARSYDSLDSRMTVRARQPVLAQPLEPVHGLEPTRSYDSLNCRVTVRALQQGQLLEPVHAFAPAHAPQSGHAPYQVEAYEPVHAFAPAHAPKYGYAPYPVQTYEPVHSSVPAHASQSGFASYPVQAYEPVHVFVPAHALQSGHAPYPVQAYEPVHTFAPAHALQSRYAPYPSQAYEPVHTFAPAHALQSGHAPYPVQSHEPVHAPQPVDHQPVHAFAQVHVPQPVQAHETVQAPQPVGHQPVQAHEAVHAPQPVGHQPVQAHETVHAPQPLQAHETVHAPQPVSHQPVPAHEAVHAQQPVQAHEAVHTQQPLQAHEAVQVPQPLQAHEAVHAQQPVQASTPVTLQAITPVQNQEPVQALQEVQAHEPVQVIAPVHTHVPSPSISSRDAPADVDVSSKPGARSNVFSPPPGSISKESFSKTRKSHSRGSLRV